MSIPAEAKQQLLNDILKLRDDARVADRMFSNIDTELGRIIDSAINQFSRHLKPSIIELRRRWVDAHKTFREHLWRSRSVAGNAQALVSDFVNICLPRLRDTTLPLQQRREELREYQHMVDRESAAEDVARSFEKLREEVKRCADRWKELREQHRRLTKEERVTKMVGEVSSVLGEFTASNLVKRIKEGMKFVLALISPMWKSLLGDPEATEDQALDPVLSSSEQLLMKLAAITGVWAMIKADIQAASKILNKLGDNTASDKIFNHRLDHAELLYKSLEAALKQYQVSVSNDEGFFPC